MCGGTWTIPSGSLGHTLDSIVRVVGSGDRTVVSGIRQRGFLAIVSKLLRLGVVAMAIGVGCDCRVDWKKELGAVVVRSLARYSVHYGG